MYDIAEYKNNTLKYLKDITSKLPKEEEKRLLIFRFSDRAMESELVNESNQAGVLSRLITCPKNISYKEAKNALNEFYHPGHIDGIVIENPNTSSALRLLDDIPRYVDVMGYRGDSKFLPAAPKGLTEYLINTFNYEFKNKICLIVGMGRLCGETCANTIKGLGSTIVWTEYNSYGFEKNCKEADIVICASNKENIVTPDMVRADTIVVDTGEYGVQNSPSRCNIGVSEMQTLMRLAAIENTIFGISDWSIYESNSRKNQLSN